MNTEIIYFLIATILFTYYLLLFGGELNFTTKKEFWITIIPLGSFFLWVYLSLIGFNKRYNDLK